MWDRVKSGAHILYTYEAHWAICSPCEAQKSDHSWCKYLQIKHSYLTWLLIAPNLTEVTLATSHKGLFFGLGWGLWFFFFVLSPGRSIHNLRSDLNAETPNFFHFPFSAQLASDAERCRNINAYFNNRAKLFNPEPCMTPLWTLAASSELLKRFWILVASSLLLEAGPATPTAMHTHFIPWAKHNFPQLI